MIATEPLLAELLAEGRHVEVDFGGDHPATELGARYP
jgi:hypothetical protein